MAQQSMESQRITSISGGWRKSVEIFYPIIAPVVVCLLYVVALIRVLEENIYKNKGFIQRTWIHFGVAPSEKDSFSTILINNIIIVAVFLVLLCIATLSVVFVLYMNWHRCLRFYFYLPPLIVMTVLTPAYFKELLASLNWFGLDLITLVLLTWNFTALGMVAIFKVFAVTPLLLQQFYLIHNSAIISVMIIYALPGWAPWLLLSLIIFWDLFAVLAPAGPLNLIIHMAERRGLVDMPGLVYSTDPHSSDDWRQEDSNQAADDAFSQVFQEGSPETSNQSPSTNTVESGTSGLTDESNPQKNMGETANESRDAVKEASGSKTATRNPEDTDNKLDPGEAPNKPKLDGGGSSCSGSEILEEGISIGLGDFIFYSLLVGISAKGQNPDSYYSIVAAIDAIIFGLVLTLIVLTTTRQAIPAIPISITLGIVSTGMASMFASRFSNSLASEQIFI